MEERPDQLRFSGFQPNERGKKENPRLIAEATRTKTKEEDDDEKDFSQEKD